MDPRTTPKEARQPPIATLAVFSYNQVEYIEAAIRGALAQTYRPLEIIVADDCSTDGTFDRVSGLANGYSGPHRLVIRRHPTNLGLAGSINWVVNHARGEYVVAAGGDDISLPTRVERLMEFLSSSPTPILAVSSLAEIIDKHGHFSGLYNAPASHTALTLQSAAQQRSAMLGCAQAWHRSLFEYFGPLPPDVLKEDLVIPFRAALLGSLGFVPEPLVLYRLHSANAHFRDSDSPMTPLELISDLKRHAGPNVAAVRTMQRDLELFASKGGRPGVEIDITRRGLEELARDAMLEYELFHGVSRSERAGVLLRAVRAGTRVQRIVRWGLTAEAPALYLQLWRWERRRQRRAFSKPRLPQAH